MATLRKDRRLLRAWNVCRRARVGYPRLCDAGMFRAERNNLVYAHLLALAADVRRGNARRWKVF